MHQGVGASCGLLTGCIDHAGTSSKTQDKCMTPSDRGSLAALPAASVPASIEKAHGLARTGVPVRGRLETTPFTPAPACTMAVSSVPSGRGAVCGVTADAETGGGPSGCPSRSNSGAVGILIDRPSRSTGVGHRPVRTSSCASPDPPKLACRRAADQPRLDGRPIPQLAQARASGPARGQSRVGVERRGAALLRPSVDARRPGRGGRPPRTSGDAGDSTARRALRLLTAARTKRDAGALDAVLGLLVNSGGCGGLPLGVTPAETGRAPVPGGGKRSDDRSIPRRGWARLG